VGVGDVPDRDDYLARWSAVHGALDPRANRLVLGWLTMVHRLARPFVRRRVPPGRITLLGALCAVAAALLAVVGGPWVLFGIPLVVATSVLDGLDGAVAVMTDRVTAWGRVLDPLADRVGDLAFLTALWVLGAPGLLVAAVGAATLVQESVRATGSAAGLRETGVVTIWERPTRVVLTSFALAGAGIGAVAGPSPALVATASAALAAVLAAVGLVQLLVSVRRRLRALDEHPPPG
jgi:phosphatidylglycerophosphate synthase